MGRAPQRTKDVYFLGAGVSVAFGLPNTQQLLSDIEDPLQERLDRAYRHFYPVSAEGASGFRPDVVDFFSLLQSHIAITRPEDGPAFPNPPLDDPMKLYTDLKWSISHRLIDGVRTLRLEKVPALEDMLRPGKVVITSNWDFLLEAYALKHGHSFYYGRNSNHANAATIIKLHGSVDWCLTANRRDDKAADDYADLTQRIMPRRASTLKGDVVRVRALEDLTRAWQFIHSRATEPFLITMAPGKNTELGPIRRLWNDAYWALSSASTLHVVGYSLPPDDVEIRALIVAGLERGNQSLKRLRVQNPAPDVHARFRNLVRRDALEDYMPLTR